MRMGYLSVQHQDWGPLKGKYKGTVTFLNNQGTVAIVLSHEASQKILDLCAEALVTQAKEVAQNLTAAIVEQSTRQPEGPSE